MNDHQLSPASALSFGPEWMRPKASRSSDDAFARQPLQNGWGNHHQAQVSPSIVSTQQPSSPKTSYTAEQLLQVYHALQVELQSKGFEEKYRSLEPIQKLVRQVEHDREYQAQHQPAPNGQNGRRNQPDQSKNFASVEKLGQKLEKFNVWAENEKNGLDFASILSNVASTRQQQTRQTQQQTPQSLQTQQTQSPFMNRSALSLHRESSFSGMNSPLNGNFLQQPSVLQPSEIKWYYIDPAGNEQGPFIGTQMQDWYTSGYLTVDLQLRREGESSFNSLRNFVTALGEPIKPFLTPLPSLQPGANTTPFSPFEQQHGLSGLFNQSPFMAQPQAQIPQFQNTQNAWDVSNSGRSSPWAQPSQTAAVDNTLGSNFMQQSSFMSSGLFGGETTAQTAPATDFGLTQEDMFSQINSEVLGDVLKDESSPAAPAAAEQQAEPVKEAAPAPVVAPAATKPVVPAPVQTKATTQTKKDVAVKETKAPVSKQEKKPKQTVKLTTTSTADAKAQSEAKSAPPAPWATQATSFTTPQMTLKQIQQLEAQEKVQQQKLRAEKAALLLATTEKTLREQEVTVKQPALPATSSWATSGQVHTPTKTLADIQREEAEAAARASRQASLALAQSLAAQQPMAQAKGSFASIAAPAASAWTVVSSKKPQPKPQQSAPMVHTTIKPITPDVLRSVSASTPVSTPASTQKSASPRQEFLSWCRSTLKLNKGVKVEDILEIMLMLPVGAEAAEIIADTIYSNSSTMDGRRFAQEFMKRRKAVESVVHDGLSWTDALHISANDDDDGWDFQVVKKKGKRKN